MDFSVLEFGGVTLILMVAGLTQFFKELFTIEGKWATALAMAMGLLVLGGVELIAFLPEQYQLYAEAVYRTIAFGLTAAGLYKLRKATIA
jgi:hypothetical protein